jgi:hypothetical protein
MHEKAAIVERNPELRFLGTTITESSTKYHVPPSQLEWALFDLAFSCAGFSGSGHPAREQPFKFSFEDSSAMRLLPLITGTKTAGPLGRSGKQSERSVISSFQNAESIGFEDDFRQWEDLLRIGD